MHRCPYFSYNQANVNILRVEFLPGYGELDNVAHFFGGFLIAWMFTIIVNAMRKHSIIRHQTPWWLTDYTVWRTVALVGIFWEFLELGMDVYFGFRMQFSIPETIGDLFFDISGGLIFLSIYRFIFAKSLPKQTVNQ